MPAGVVRGRDRAAHRLHFRPARPACGGVALSAGHEPQAAGEVRLPRELSEPARLRVRAARHRGCRSALPRIATRAAATGPTSLAAADLVLSPAACYPLYPLGREPRPRARRRTASSMSPRTASAASLRAHSTGCSRSACASSCASARPEEIAAFREGWMTRAQGLAEELALPHTLDVASDPFFGRVGQIMAVSQLQQSLKFELLIPYLRGREAHRVHELQLSPRRISARCGDCYDATRRARAHRLRRLWHGPPGGGAVRQSRHRSGALAGLGAPRARAMSATVIRCGALCDRM